MAFRIVKHDKIWFSISGLLCLLSIVALAVFGLNLSIDFTGGTLMSIESQSEISVETLKEQIRTAEAEVNAVVAAGGEGAVVDTTETDEEIAITPPASPVNLGDPEIVPAGNVYNIKLRATDEYTHREILNNIRSIYPDAVENKFETIGPSVGANIAYNALVALVVAILAIIAYIAFAFRKVPKRVQPWKFGVVAVIALFHDVLITLGIFALLGAFMNVEIDTFFVTAILTVLGYSVNDTIVVFDRLRENLKQQKRGETFTHLAESSLWQTMRRSINTSMTILIVLLALFFAGDESIKWFVFALIIGTIVGTYSSIFLATPLLVRWSKK